MKDTLLIKAIIIEDLGKGEYIVKDICSNHKIEIKFSGKQRMNYYNIKIGEEIYVQYSPDYKRGRMITGTQIKMDETNKLFAMKLSLDSKLKDMKK